MNRTIAFIGAVAVLAAIYVLVLEPMAEKRVEMQQEVVLKYSTLVKYSQYRRLKDKSAEKLAAAEKRLKELETDVLPPLDTSVAFARLQRNVQRMATQSGLTVTSIKPLPTKEFKTYTGLPIFMDCTGDIKELSEFLRQIDHINTLLDIDRLNISTQQDGRLRVKIQLTGLMVSA